MSFNFWAAYVHFIPYHFGRPVDGDLSRRKFLGQGLCFAHSSLAHLMQPCAGYKVGRVDQAETALGAEMRVKADKSKGKVSADKNKEKIVRR
jgi:hypothetical protein